LRQALQEAALRITRSLAYRGAGTVEFLVDVPAGAFYFLEMNARIQVEHPVTEMVTGIDLVAEQFHIAAGGALRIAPDAARPAGWAIECRIHAEDPARGFTPSPGTGPQARRPAGQGTRGPPHCTT